MIVVLRFYKIIADLSAWRGDKTHQKYITKNDLSLSGRKEKKLKIFMETEG
jgi:hypothetical protein